ncbi:MAG TPA: hypothetical protein VJX30_16195 [Terriglobales bacterium]|nr:hypothetical protein [Terriglobales bacterium]
MKKVGRNAVVLGGVEFRPSQSARQVAYPGSHFSSAGSGPRLASKERTRTWGHRLVRHDDLSKLNAEFFTMNGVISVVFFLFVTADLLLTR